MVVAIYFHQRNFAQLAFIQKQFLGFSQVRRAAPLGAYLDHSIVFAGCRQHGRALTHIRANRLLNIDVGARLSGLNHDQCVPVVGHADEDNVQPALAQHLPEVAVRFRRLARYLARRDNSGGVREHSFVYIAKRNYLHRLHLY